jgi:glycosyltransferase involved in cell wall biosynthesis
MPMTSVAILMATYNGEKHLREQLDSFKAQTFASWSLHVSDDGSTDRSRVVVDMFTRDHPEHKVTLVDGPRQGYAKNFLSLLEHTITDAPYFAFSDQDDIWHADKLARAVAWLEGVSAETPALYGARTLYVNEENKQVGMSAIPKKPLTFANALVQCYAGATMCPRMIGGRIWLSAVSAASCITMRSHACAIVSMRET